MGRPTPTGLGLAAASVTAVGLGRVFGAVELYYVGTVGLLLVVLAVLLVAPPRVAASRRIAVSRVQAGGHARVDVMLVNPSRRASPVLALHDPVTATRGVTVLAAPVRTGGGRQLSYRLSTPRRGRLRVGPLSLRATDPLGLAASSASGPSAVDVVVLPRWEQVRPPPLTAPRAAGDEHRRPRSDPATGGEFRALREYTEGDDLRRVHWAASARTDELLVREDDPVEQVSTTVLLDTRAEVHDGPGFEAAVSAAASVLVAAAGREDALRLLTTAGADSGPVPPGDVDRLLEQLATVSPSAGLRTVVQPVADAGCRVVVTGRLGVAGTAPLQVAGRLAVLVTTGPAPHSAPCPVVALTGRPFGAVWDAELRARSRTAVAR